MDIKRAQKIINRYGKTIELTATFIFGAPISMLPYSKKQIKEAIGIALKHTKQNENIDDLIYSFLDLARFIEEDKAIDAIKGWILINSPKKKKNLLNNDKSSKEHDVFLKASRINEVILRKQEILSKELKALLINKSK